MKIAAHGTDTKPSSDFTGDIFVNAVYTDPGKSSDHLVGSAKNIEVSDGWVHLTCKFTVSTASVDRGEDTFCLYANPVDSKGVGYYLDNVKITEILPQ